MVREGEMHSNETNTFWIHKLNINIQGCDRNSMVLGFMFYTCTLKDMIHANRIFALMLLLELDPFPNSLQLA